MRKGFTLVELSIVLVIIGLLIGGILSAQSMIATAKIHSFLRQIGQTDAAISNYQQMYNGLPGDYTGNQNGVIEDDGVTYGPKYIVRYNGEVPNFWPELSAMTRYDPAHNYTATITGTFNSDISAPNAPTTPFGKNAYLIPSSFDSDKIYNWYRVANISEVTAANPDLYPSSLGGTYTGDLNAIDSKDVLAICSKIDDGSMEEGNGGAFVDNQKVAFGINYPDWTQGCTLAHDKCDIYIRMLSAVGQMTQ